MKAYTSMLLISIFVSLLSGCSTPTQSTPSLQDFQTNTLPSGGADAALAAQTTY